jgi:hypothetical protein
MGGYGSGRHWTSVKRTVESSRVLEIEYFSRRHRDDPGGPYGALIGRTFFGTELEVRYEFEIKSRELLDSRLRLRYTAEGSQEYLDYEIPLTYMTQNYGGFRWWFLCPISNEGVLCNRRTSRLYLPPCEKYFGCRKCHDLTYMSCQESHKNTIFAQLAKESGMTKREVITSIRESLGSRAFF